MQNERFEFLKTDFVRGFPAYCGLEVEHVDDGIFESRLTLRPEHHQREGFAHAGLMATMADHTAGYAAYTVVPETYSILTIEFKINYLKPATGDMIICRSRVLNKGRKIIVSESEIYSKAGQTEKLVSKATVTLMAVPGNNETRCSSF